MKTIKQIININKNYPFTLKYQPNLLCEVLDYKYIVDIFNILIKTVDNSIFPHILIYGPPGSGKTSLIQTIINELFTNTFNYLIINASEKRGVEVIRNNIYSFLTTLSMDNNKLKLIILDEVDNLTQDAQIILKSIINENKNVKFIFICNYEIKINISLKSNCLYLKMDKMNYSSLFDRCLEICIYESIMISNKGLKTIIKYCKLDIRKILNILQSIKIIFNNSLILKNTIKNYLKIPTKKKILNLIEYFQNNKSMSDKINYFSNFSQYNIIDVIYTIVKLCPEKTLEIAKLEKYIYAEINKDIIIIFLINIFN